MEATTPLLSLLIGLFCLSGCAPQSYGPTEHTPASSMPYAASRTEVRATLEPETFERLAYLWQERTQQGTVTDHPLGPGDVLEISVPAIPELKDRTVRISGEGTITLPFVGMLPASGLSDAALSQEITQRLRAYMHQPQVILFVREYRSRQVAVIGAVAKPGLYTLASGADSILSMLAAAGGTTDDAAPRLLLLPAEYARREMPLVPRTTPPIRFVAMHAAAPVVSPQVEPLVIDLQTLQRGEQQRYLSLPARPGDVILVPSAGHVLVEGWVEKPGSYKISQDLTVLGAVAAAGGPRFPADTSAVKVLRAGKDAGKVVLLADLDSIKRGEAPDVPVRAGDVLEVSSSAVKMLPYGFYRFFSAIVNVGVGASVPLR